MTTINSLGTPGIIKSPPSGRVRQSGKSAASAIEECMHKSVLSVSPTAEEDHATLSCILDGLPWNVSAVTNCREAIGCLLRDSVSVILCESTLEDGTWRDILNHIKKSANPPLLVVASRLADEYLWAEVLNLGAYDVLAKPFSQREVRHVLTNASLSLAHSALQVRSAGAD